MLSGYGKRLPMFTRLLPRHRSLSIWLGADIRVCRFEQEPLRNPDFLAAALAIGSPLSSLIGVGVC